MGISGGFKSPKSNYAPSYLNGYKDWTDTTYEGVSVSQLDNNLITFKGLMYIGTVGSAAFTLPVSMRPSKNLIATCITGSHGAVIVYILSNGNVEVGGGATGDYVTLTGISYLP